MKLDEYSDLIQEVGRTLRRSGGPPLGSDESRELRDYMLSEERRAPYDSIDLKEAVAHIREQRGTDSGAPPPSRRGRAHGLVARAMRECEERVGAPKVQRQVEQWRLEAFGVSDPPLSAEGPVPFVLVADWIEEQWRQYPEPGDSWSDLAYPGRRAKAEIRVTPWLGDSTPPNALQRLLMAAQTVTSAVGCSQDQAVGYVATGVVPFVPPAIAYRDRSRFDGDRYQDGPLIVRVNFDWVPADIVRDLYHRTRRPTARLERTTTAGAKMRVLSEFLHDRPNTRWAALFDEWNRTHPEWAYEKLNSFREVGRRRRARPNGGER